MKPQKQKKNYRFQPCRDIFTCQVCGYVYEGEVLPADYTCPICQASAERFEKR